MNCCLSAHRDDLEFEALQINVWKEGFHSGYILSSPNQKLLLPGTTPVSAEMSPSVAFDVIFTSGWVGTSTQEFWHQIRNAIWSGSKHSCRMWNMFFCMNMNLNYQLSFLQVLKVSNKNPVNQMRLTLKSNSCRIVTFWFLCSERAFCQS